MEMDFGNRCKASFISLNDINASLFPQTVKSNDTMETDSDASMASSSGENVLTPKTETPGEGEDLPNFSKQFALHPLMAQYPDDIEAPKSLIDVVMKYPTFPLSSGFFDIPGAKNSNFAPSTTEVPEPAFVASTTSLPPFSHPGAFSAFLDNHSRIMSLSERKPLGIVQGRGMGPALIMSPVAPRNTLRRLRSLERPLTVGTTVPQPKDAATAPVPAVVTSNKTPDLQHLLPPLSIASLASNTTGLSSVDVPVHTAPISTDATSLKPLRKSALSSTATKSNTNGNNRKFKRWSAKEDNTLRNAMKLEWKGPFKWKNIARKYFNNSRTGVQCKSRWSKSLQPGIVKGPWKAEEDALILKYKEGGLKWSAMAQLLPGRVGESIRDRYVNTLNPALKKTPWSPSEDAILFREQSRIGNKWTQISTFIQGRSENSVKNRWHNRKTSNRRKMHSLTAIAKTRRGAAAGFLGGGSSGQINKTKTEPKDAQADSMMVGV